MRVFIDGQEVPAQNSVKVIFDGLARALQLHCTLNPEGLVLDVVDQKKISEGDEDVVATASWQAGDLLNEMF